LNVLIFSGLVFAAQDIIDPHNSPLQVIAFGSCTHQDHAQPVWEAVNAESADLFVILGTIFTAIPKTWM
jgi:hypothetical protein